MVAGDSYPSPAFVQRPVGSREGWGFDRKDRGGPSEADAGDVPRQAGDRWCQAADKKRSDEMLSHVDHEISTDVQDNPNLECVGCGALTWFWCENANYRHYTSRDAGDGHRVT